MNDLDKFFLTFPMSCRNEAIDIVERKEKLVFFVHDDNETFEKYALCPANDKTFWLGCFKTKKEVKELCKMLDCPVEELK